MAQKTATRTHVPGTTPRGCYVRCALASLCVGRLPVSVTVSVSVSVSVSVCSCCAVCVSVSVGVPVLVHAHLAGCVRGCDAHADDLQGRKRLHEEERARHAYGARLSKSHQQRAMRVRVRVRGARDADGEQQPGKADAHAQRGARGR